MNHRSKDLLVGFAHQQRRRPGDHEKGDTLSLSVYKSKENEKNKQHVASKYPVIREVSGHWEGSKEVSATRLVTGCLGNGYKVGTGRYRQ